MRTGITYSAMICSVPLQRERQARGNEKFIRTTTVKNPKTRALDVLLALKKEDVAILEELRRPPGTSIQTYTAKKIICYLQNVDCFV